jgi:hypothetical protein
MGATDNSSSSKPNAIDAHGEIDDFPPIALRHRRAPLGESVECCPVCLTGNLQERLQSSVVSLPARRSAAVRAMPTSGAVACNSWLAARLASSITLNNP